MKKLFIGLVVLLLLAILAGCTGYAGDPALQGSGFSANRIPYIDSSGLLSGLPAGSAGQVFTSNGSALPYWSTVTANGSGDMLKSTYDTDGDGKVNSADSATTSTNAANAINIVPGGAVNTGNVTDSNLTANQDVYATTAGLLASKAISGSTFPTSPKAGDLFMQSTTGRKWLYQYDGSAWQTVIAYGNTVIYVDPSGTNDLAHGTGTGTNAFATLQYAIDKLPPVCNGTAEIHLGVGNYGENVDIPPKTFNTDYDPQNGQLARPFRIYGTLTNLESLTCGNGSVQGTGSTQGTVVRGSGSWTLNQRGNKLLTFTSGVNNTQTALIDSNTAGGTATIMGVWNTGAPANGDAFTVYDWGTTVTSIVTIGNPMLDIFDMSIGTFAMSEHQYAALTRCTVTSYMYVTNSEIDFVTSYCASSDHQIILNMEQSSQCQVYGAKFVTSYSAWGACIQCSKNSCVSLSTGTILDGTSASGSDGVSLDGLSVVSIGNVALWGYVRIRNCAQYGIRAIGGSHGMWTANTVYSNNGTNASADATSYSYIQS